MSVAGGNDFASSGVTSCDLSVFGRSEPDLLLFRFVGMTMSNDDLRFLVVVGRRDGVIAFGKDGRA